MCAVTLQVARDDDLLAELSPIAGVTVLVDEPLARHTSFGIGGPADLFIEPTDIAGLQQVMRALHARGIQPAVFGNGTNLLVRDGGIRGAVIRLAGEFTSIRQEDGFIIAGAAASLSALCRYCADHGWGGLKFAAGIPGTVGGAVVMNAGANGGDMAQVVEWVRVVTPEGRIRRRSRDELGFGYRRSDLQGAAGVIAEVAFALAPADAGEEYQRFCETVLERCCKQPVAQRSAGSIFKRPKADYAGRLLEASGAKGLRVGGAVVSTKHANFIVNEGGATARDVLELIELVRGRVRENFGIELETEIVVVGED